MPPEFQNYIDQILPYIKWKKARYLVDIELSEHLDNLYERGKIKGLDHQQAIQAALEHVGPVKTAGPAYNKASRPHHAWEAMLVILLFVCGGLLLLFFSDVGTATVLTYAVTYILAFAAGYRLDCAVLKNRSKAVYWSYTILLGVAAILEAVHVVQGVTPYVFMLFPLVFCGAVYNSIQTEKPASTRRFILPFLLPLLLYLLGRDQSQAIPVLLTCAALLSIGHHKVGGDKRKAAITAGVGAAAAIAIMLLLLMAMPHTSLSSLDPSGFFARREELRAAVSGAMPFGTGQDSGWIDPYLEDETLLLYIVRMFGIPGLLIVLLSAGFLAHFTLHRIKVSTSRFYSLAAMTALIQIMIAVVIDLLGNFGLGMISTRMAFPYLSPGFPAIASLFLSGIMLGAVRDGLVSYD